MPADRSGGRSRYLPGLLLAGAVAVPTITAAQSTPSRDDRLPIALRLNLALATKVHCSGIFVSRRNPHAVLRLSTLPRMPEDAQEAHRRHELQFTVDRSAKIVSGTWGDYAVRAGFFGDQGCVILPEGSSRVFFTPTPVVTTLPDPASQPWPMGDRHSGGPLPPGVDGQLLEQAADRAFSDSTDHTAAFIVVHKGRIVAERYGPGIDRDTQLESWSMGKSLTATMLGVLARDGRLGLWAPAPIPAWRLPGDPRSAIRIADLLRMSSGLAFTGGEDSDERLSASQVPGYPDHIYVYSAPIDVFAFSISRPVEYAPNTVGRYRNCDPLSLGYIIKQTVQASGEDYLTWPQRALFDRIGIRRQVMETDPYGNFVLTGFDYGTIRNWARVALLYQQDGMWNGERILPKGWAEFVSTPAPAWPEPSYGGLFWINGDRQWKLPINTYYMSGGSVNKIFVIPDRDLIIGRMGHAAGMGKYQGRLNEALELILQAIETEDTR